ncbi:MAG: nicotinate-nucleotide--dimethylbenzimidazole phosphoribosyltransferase [Acidimicrobiales bacterium]
MHNLGTGAAGTAADALAPLSASAMDAAGARQATLTKPPGALGRLEELSVQLAGIAGTVPPPLPSPAAIAVFAGDHGVHAEGVSPWPQEVTAQMVANFCGGGAAINVLARQAGARVVVVDVGVATPVVAQSVAARPACVSWDGQPGDRTGDDARRGAGRGRHDAADLVADGARCLVAGDMGIANDTCRRASRRLHASASDEVTGRHRHRRRHARPQDRHRRGRGRAMFGNETSPLEVLAEVGGLRSPPSPASVIAAAAVRCAGGGRRPITAAALCVVDGLVPAASPTSWPGTVRSSRGVVAALAHLGIEPLLDRPAPRRWHRRLPGPATRGGGGAYPRRDGDLRRPGIDA